MNKSKEDEVFDQALLASVKVLDEPKTRRLIKTRPEKTPEQKAEEAQERERKRKQDETDYMVKHVAGLKAEGEKALTEYERIIRLQKEFPDLRQQTDRWRNVRYKSASVNGQCDSYSMVRSCGCCPDPAIWAQPFVEMALGRVFSDPYQFYIGEGKTYTWMREEHGWEEKMEAAGIRPGLIKAIRRDFDAELQIANADEDEDED